MSRYNGGGVSRGCLITLVSVIAIVVLIGSIVIGGYNKAVRFDEDVKGRWAQVDTALKRRFDLIPNLVETVKGYAGHEKDTLENVTRARTQAVSAQGVGAQAAAEGELSQALGRLMMVVEQYPDLKANQNFLSLQEELTSTENKIGFSRQFYNDEVMKYNTRIQSVPTNIVAGVFRFTEEEFFELQDEAAREAPKVSFS